MFKEGKRWTSEMKRQLMVKVFEGASAYKLNELFSLLTADFPGISVGSIQGTYYQIISTEGDSVRDLIKELEETAGAKIAFNPFVDKRVYNSPNGVKVEAKAIVADQKPSSEEKILSGVGSLVENLMKLKDANTTGFINGLNAIVMKASDHSNSEQVEKLKGKIKTLEKDIGDLTIQYNRIVEESRKREEELQAENAKLKEDLDFVGNTLTKFCGMSPGEKIANIGIITKGLKTTIDQSGCVVKVDRL